MKPQSNPSSLPPSTLMDDQAIEQMAVRQFQPNDLFELLLENPILPPPEEISTPPAPSNISLAPGSLAKSGCKCSKISCLKLYCQCFAKGQLCSSDCTCINCLNCPTKIPEITHAKSLVNLRHPHYFKGIPTFTPTRKCTCRRSRCNKRYCECFNAGMKCTGECCCENCHNAKSEASTLEEAVQGGRPGCTQYRI